MASRINLRLLTRVVSRPTTLSSNLRFGQRLMSSGAPKQSSDTAWIAGAGIFTVGGLALVLSSGNDSKGSHHGASHATEKNPTPKKEELEDPTGDNGKPGAKHVEEDGDSKGALESTQQAIKSDGPPIAKSDEERSNDVSKSDSGSDSDGDYVKVSADDLKDSLSQAEKADVPAVAKPSEEKAAHSK